MIPPQAEIARHLQGAWLLARGDRRGLSWFDLSVDGFWRSFSAALVVAPVYALVLLEQHAAAGWPERPWRAALAETAAYACGWVTFPLAAVLLTRLLGLTARYVTLVVAVNWSAVLQIALYAAVVTVGLVLPAGARGTLLLAATLLILAYQWFVIRTALATGTGTATGLVLIDVLLGMTVSRAVDALFYPA